MEKEKRDRLILIVLLGLAGLMVLINFISAADPVGPDSVVYGTNETKQASAAQMVNISGGRILSLNLTANTQNPRWKAFVGNVVGSFTLDDASGATIYDWSLSSITGRVYSTRTSGAVFWSGIGCANTTTMEAENVNINHSSSEDNITATFSDNTHSLFWVGSNSITANTCPTLNTYVDNSTQDTSFEEMVLYDGNSNLVYATILEEDVTGYDGQSYDFQMIVPENGLPSFSGATAYYLYVEIGN